MAAMVESMASKRAEIREWKAEPDSRFCDARLCMFLVQQKTKRELEWILVSGQSDLGEFSELDQAVIEFENW